MTQATPKTVPPESPPRSDAALAGVLALGGTSLVMLAAAHRARQVALSAHARSLFARLWRFLDPRHPQASWARLNARAVVLLTAAQGEAARGADRYVSAALAMQGATPDPVGLVPAPAFAGTAADGRDLPGLLGYPAFQVEAFVSQGMSPERASAIGARHLDRIVATEVSDAARVATGVAVVGDRAARGYVRMLTLPSCMRCVILAGRWYAVNKGFKRHEFCDCIHMPAAEVIEPPDPKALFDAMSEQELKAGGWSKATVRAINDGADIFQSVNARRSLHWVDIAGQRLRATRVNTSRKRPIRLVPESIYEIAGGNRDEAIRLLVRFGYIV